MLCLILTSSVSAGQSPQKQRADSLLDRYEERKAMNAYLEVLEQSPEMYEALWKASLLHSREGHRKEEEDRQRELYLKARELASRALEVDSTGAEANFAMSVAYGRLAMISGARDKLRASREVKHYAERALEYDPEHPGAWHVLGVWHLKVSNLNFFERLAANTLFGGIPGDPSEEKAAEYIERAIELDPKFIRYYLDLASVYEEMGREEDAVETCRRGMKQPPRAEDDPELKEQCRELIEDLR